MCNDEVKSPESLGACVTDIHDMQTDIPQAQGRHARLPRDDRTLRKVKTDKLAFRELEGHAQEVTAYAATQFEYATSVYGGRLHATQKSNRRKPVRVSLRIDCARIQNIIIGTRSIWGSFHTPLG
jgi:hypothetical protein